MSLFILVFFTKSMINKNNEYVIKKEIIDIKKHSDIYLQQVFLKNNNGKTEDFFKNYGKKISDELSSEIGYRVVLYSTKGEFIYDSSGKNGFVNGGKTDLSMAENDKIGYSINYTKNVVDVNFSYGVSLNNTKVGIIRYKIDYTDLYKTGKDLIDMIEIASLILFVIIVVVAFIISREITSPIEKLNKLTKRISEGDFNVSVNIKSRDEIGELSENFNLMAEKIKTQMNKIIEDSESIKTLESHRKNFFDNVTHELKTPLTTILGYSQIIEENGFKKDEEFFEKGIKYIISESERLRRMVIGLLEFSQIEKEYNFKQFNLSQLIANTCEELQIKANRYNININSEIQNELLVMGDKDKLKQVFINVIDNSIKYGFENSIIRVRAMGEKENIEITVEDSGEGILEDKLQNIFQPFYRANKSNCAEKGSSGLGLSISKAIIDRHKGKITIESKLKVGTIVTIEL